MTLKCLFFFQSRKVLLDLRHPIIDWTPFFMRTMFGLSSDSIFYFLFPARWKNQSQQAKVYLYQDWLCYCLRVCVLYWEGCLLLFLKTETPQILGLRLCCVIDNSLVSYTIEYRRLISRFFLLLYIFRVNDKLPHFGSDHYQFISQLFECNDIPLHCIYDFLCFSTNL